ncbi:MAG TPA: CDP-diacylglycerol--glycerol-3-phosphate 3-phosphatidyltransferase [Deltaproteobacteria bacterium]|nr:MAG: CDP-diacylglycerol--glycerol-3-phosphate 3-phosphatidyltransferase [Deltaproteobacteria bacterium GWA2_45_12]HBF13874.1 CDP-diacylglycerol--glycerol-3-phosphate 3-phosphatidyltransferase [Deltaproteobacteria bacterium]
MATQKQKIFNVPNILTLGRIATIPIIMGLLFLQMGQNTFEFNKTVALVSAILFILAGISDLVDGAYARKYGQVSLMGKFFDPMADKLIHLSVMILLIPLGRFPAWLAILHLFREIFVSGMRSVAAGEGLIISASKMAKKKTAWLNVGLAALLVHYDILGVSAYSFGWVCTAVGTFYSILSGVEYGILFFKEMKKK